LNDPVSSADQNEPFCADLSFQAGEPLPGTALRVDVWFILEYAGLWTAEATQDNLLPPSTQAWLAEALALVDRSRVQFIKQNRPAPAAGLAFFLALTHETTPLLYEFHLDTYHDLESLDLQGLLAGHAGRQHLRTRPLYLVCTNGRRDRCCSRLGLGLYLALANQVGAAAWQTTHLGGHRFAPTLLTLPDGACYGHLIPADLAPMVQAQEAGRFYLDRLRGRCCYVDLVQAADWFLRRETGHTAAGDYRLLDTRPLDGFQWLIRFVAPSTNQAWQVTLARTMSEPAGLVSCSPPANKPVPHFQLLSITQSP
jgi:hypothetical protein